jgi:hypothetical protein
MEQEAESGDIRTYRPNMGMAQKDTKRPAKLNGGTP